MSVLRPLLSALALSLAFAQPALAAKPAKAEAQPAPRTEIELSHRLSGESAERLGKLVEQFNQQSKDAQIKLSLRAEGSKASPLNLATREDVLQFVAAKASFKPLHQVMSEAKEKFELNLSPDLRAGVLADKGKLVALPVAYSTPVLFYNKGAFRKAGLDADKPPQTWLEVQNAADKLQDVGYTCPYTTSWPIWVHIDNVSALSGVPVSSGKNHELAFNGLPQVKHIAMLATWQKARFYQSFGRRDEADSHFHSGECAMLTSNASALGYLREAPGIELGVAPLPYHEDVYGGRQHTLADGGSLWVGAGFKPAEYKAAARFISFLLSTEKQVELAKVQGLLPLTHAAQAVLKQKIAKDEEQALNVTLRSLNGEGATHPLRISAIEPVRQILDEELEAVWANQKPAKAALDTAVQRGNAVLNAKPALKKLLPF